MMCLGNARTSISRRSANSGMIELGEKSYRGEVPPPLTHALERHHPVLVDGIVYATITTMSVLIISTGGNI